MAKYIDLIDLASSKGFNDFLENNSGATVLYPSPKEIVMQLAIMQAWLRDEHNIELIQMFPTGRRKGFNLYKDGEEADRFVTARTYEQALLEGIFESLKMIS